MTNEQNLTPEQKWENATLANNFIFYKVMRQRLEVNQLLLISTLPTILIRNFELIALYSVLRLEESLLLPMCNSLKAPPKKITHCTMGKGIDQFPYPKHCFVASGKNLSF